MKKENQVARQLLFECVVQNLRRASRVVSRRYEDALRPVNLTSSQFTILQSLHVRNNLPQGIMADVLGFEQTTISRLIKPLERRGLISLGTDPKDKRGKLVSLTTQGEKLFAEAKELWRTEQDKSLSRIDEEDWAVVKDVLRQLSD